MSLVRYLQHWLRGTGVPLHVADFVPETHPMRPWADTFPWAALVAAMERSFAQRFPRRSPRGRPTTGAHPGVAGPRAPPTRRGWVR
jgi:hypothetical protein